MAAGSRTDRGLLRLITAGSVDDGKSTLIGRLLHDTRAILADQLAAIERASRARGAAAIDLSLLTDGLEDERARGITIDVAYRYFSTPVRKFIIGDSPGHVEYTRNMVTAASTADVAVLLVDARNGLVSQTRRHTCLAHWLGIRHVVLAVNKMDLIGYSQTEFERHRLAFEAFASRFHFAGIAVIPISALCGDMVVERGKQLDWYRGPTLLEQLESLPTLDQRSNAPFRMAVQRVALASGTGTADGPWLCGTIAQGRVSVGEAIVVMPEGRRGVVASILVGTAQADTSCVEQAVSLRLGGEARAKRGDMLCTPTSPPAVVGEVVADLLWLVSPGYDPGAAYLLKHTTRTVPVRRIDVLNGIDVETFERSPRGSELQVNEIAEVRLSLDGVLCVDEYARNRVTGSFILIDAETNATVAAGIVRDPHGALQG